MVYDFTRMYFFFSCSTSVVLNSEKVYRALNSAISLNGRSKMHIRLNLQSIFSSNAVSNYNMYAEPSHPDSTYVFYMRIGNGHRYV